MSTHVYMYNVFKNAVAGLGDMSLVVCLRIYICTMFSKLQSQCWVICHYHGACVYAYVHMYNVFKNAVAVLGDMSLVVCLRIYIYVQCFQNCSRSVE